MAVSTFHDRMTGWHKQIAEVTGMMTLCIEKSSVKRSQLRQWANSLDRVSREIRWESGDDS